jgi:putative ABC transport system permease protein
MFSDLKFAFRQLLKNRGFALGVISILALAIGANTAEFSLTRAIFFKPLPWQAADRLVYVFNTAANIGWPLGPISIPDYLDRRNQTTCFANTALYLGISADLSAGPRPAQVMGMRVTPSFFTTLGVSPVQGRAFTADEGVSGRDQAAIISYDLWQSKFNGESNCLGSDLRVDGETYRIVGIMPQGFLSPALGWVAAAEPAVQLWLPLAFTSKQMADGEHGDWQYDMIARLAPGVTLAQAQAQIDEVQQRREKVASPVIARKMGGFGGIIAGYREQATAGVRPMLLILQAAVVMILLIAGANVGNLLLVRATVRRREMAIRVALGCGRFRLVRQVFTESIALVLLGAAGGIGVGFAGVAVIRKLGGSLPLVATLAIDPVVLGFTLLLSLGVGGALGCVALLSLWGHDPAEGLRDGTSRGSAGRSTGRLRAGLIVAEVALALMLLIAAGLTLRSVANLQRVRPGFNSERVLTARVSLPLAQYRDEAADAAFFQRALGAIRSLPGVNFASAVSYAPFSGEVSTSNYRLMGEPRKPGEPGKNAQFETIDPDYFRAMQIPLRGGRFFSTADAASAPPAVIIDEFLADRYFSGRNPLGRKILIPTDDLGGFRIWTIVGVVGEVKTASLADPVVKETLYFPLAQNPSSAMSLIVKTGSDPAALGETIRGTIQRIDPELPVFDVQTMDHRIDGSMAGYRSPMILLLLFGSAALGLATLGIYAVLAYAVSQRTREIGIRIALGAQRRAILVLIVGQGLRLSLAGVGLGLVASFGLNRYLRSLLFGVSPSDPLICGALPALLLVVALAACYFPARRASKVDPMVALRAE